jgi:hypothetical protein
LAISVPAQPAEPSASGLVRAKAKPADPSRFDAHPTTLPEPAICVATSRPAVTVCAWEDPGAVLRQTGVSREDARRRRLGRVGTVEDLMGAVLFVASDPPP